MTLPNYAMPTLLILLIAANIGLIAVLNPLVKRLKASGDKCGMVHFELAGNARNAKRIMAIWRKASLKQEARISLCLGLTDIDPAAVQVMDSVGHIPDIRRVEIVYAVQHAKTEHFRGFVS
jgi:hypothetical protein